MAQFTILIPHVAHDEEFVARFPSAEGRSAAGCEAEALDYASEKFLDSVYLRNEDVEYLEELVQPGNLSAYEIHDEETDQVVIGWEIDSI